MADCPFVGGNILTRFFATPFHPFRWNLRVHAPSSWPHIQQLREGGWWAGILATSLGIVATGINAYTPVGSYLVSWLVWLGLATFLVNLVTLLVLDGALWIDTRVRSSRICSCFS